MDILTLSTYPIDTPQHGGQHRLANIVRTLRGAGHRVSSIGILGSDQYPSSDGFLSYPGIEVLKKYISDPVLMDDWAIGELAANDDPCFSRLAALVRGVPNLIHVEQPWLFRFALRLVQQLNARQTKIVYGSQNIEHELKHTILKTFRPAGIAADGQRKVLECERLALKHADGVCCVSLSDLDWSKTQTDSPIVLAQNGVREFEVDSTAIAEANHISGHKQFALYCASAHPPNITGFFRVFGNGIGCFRPDQRLIVVGSAGPALHRDPRFAKTAGLARAFSIAGTVSDRCLAGLLHTAHALVLPITEGGGTNLKTAEAIWAGKHVVATKTAMRGFEEFCSSKGVNVCEGFDDFAVKLSTVLCEPPLRLTEAERALRRSVLWERTLQPLHDLIRELG
jgi:hypothetical protein